MIFSHATGYMSNPNNYNNYFGRIYQARYLAGIAAGLKSLETNNNNVGYVSAYGTEYAETCSGINGFALGVQAVNPDATVYVKELGNWFDEVNEYAFAEELINSYNCGVIAQPLRLCPASAGRGEGRRVWLRLQLRHDQGRPQRPPDCPCVELGCLLQAGNRDCHGL